MTERLQEMRDTARFVNAINREVFRGGLRLHALENPVDISTIVTVQDNAISRMYLQDGIGEFEGVQRRLPGSFSEEMDSPQRRSALKAYELDPIDGTGDLKFSADSGKPYGATNLVSRLERQDISHPFTSTAGLIFDFVDEMALLGDGYEAELCKVDGNRLVKIPWKLNYRPYMDGEPIRIGKRDAYPHEGFDAFLRYLKDGKKLKLEVVRIGGAGRGALQLFRTNMDTDGPVPDDYKKTAIDVFFNYQPDHKTWDLDPTLAMHRCLNVTTPTSVYGNGLDANAALPPYSGSKDAFDPLAWHKKGYLYSARGTELHTLMANAAKDFERDTGHSVLAKKL